MKCLTSVMKLRSCSSGFISVILASCRSFITSSKRAQYLEGRQETSFIEY